jgi:hypothetical protein
MIVEPHVCRYQTLLAEYLFTEDGLAREASLTAVDDLAQALLPLHVSLDELLTLHSSGVTCLPAERNSKPSSSWRVEMICP